MIQEKIRDLRGNPRYEELLKELDDLIPELPPWEPSNPTPVEVHAYHSGYRAGITHLISIFKGEEL